MLDDRDAFFDRETTDLLGAKLAPKWFSTLFLIFNLLGARGVYFNLLNFNAWDVFLSFLLWGVTFYILYNHNNVYKKVDEALRR